MFQGEPQSPWGKEEIRVSRLGQEGQVGEEERRRLCFACQGERLEQTNKLVFIGKNLNRQELIAGFEACLVSN
eukprot:759211-Hanusia_phi.AAC.1